MARISVNLSDTLRASLADACEKSGRSLTAEVEARLRHSLDIPGSDRLLLLRFDEGLWAWVNAYERGVSLWGNLHDAVIAMIRTQVMEGTGEVEISSQSSRWPRRLARMKPFLPDTIQRAFDRQE
jgi:hypothetical protein